VNKELLFEALFFSMKGSILISSPDLLTDHIFYKSIIIIVDESEDGYTGFILNKPGGYFFIRNEKKFNGLKYQFNFGGPVSKSTFFITENIEFNTINDFLSWGDNVELIFEKIENGYISEDKVLFFQGYSGWSKTQLEDEIANQFWIIQDFEYDLFSLTKKNSWKTLIKKLGGQYKVWYNSPDDITLN